MMQKLTLGWGSPSSTEVAVVSVSSSSDAAIEGSEEGSEETSETSSCFFLRLLGVNI